MAVSSPIFKEQIEQGTNHCNPSEVTRYFNTIPEAVRLVIQAQGIGVAKCLFWIWEPVKIIDLVKDLIANLLAIRKTR